MDFSFSQDQQELRTQIIAFARGELNEGADERDRNQTFDPALFRKCGEMGLPGLPVPEEYGGVGLDPLSTAIAMEAFGYGCKDGGLVFSVCAHLLACVVPIWRHGSEEQKRKYLPRLTDGSLIAVNAMTEPHSGSDAFSMTARAVPDGDGFRINGTKTFSSNGPVAGLALVYAMTGPEGKEITGFLVEAGTPGFQVGQRFEKMGLRSATISELVFEDVWVPADAVLGKVGGGPSIFTESMDWERIHIGATHLGTMQRLLETAIQYARTRRSSGKAIGKYQAVAHRIADMKMRLESARWVTYRAASRLGASRDVGLDASMVKVIVSETLIESALSTIKVLGGYGFMQEYEVERVMRDSVGGVLYSGTNEIQRNMIAKWLGL